MGAIDAKGAIRDPQMQVLIERSFSLGFGRHPLGHLLNSLRKYAPVITSNLVRKGTALALACAAHLSLPVLIVNPPTVDFGLALIVTTATRTLTLTNKFACPICLTIDYPQTSEWGVHASLNVISQSGSVDIE
jgi:hypothetical protein